MTGCLAQRYRQEIIDEIPEVDAVLGTTAYDKIVEAVEEALAGAGHVELENVNALPHCRYKAPGDNRWTLCLYEDCRRL